MNNKTIIRKRIYRKGELTSKFVVLTADHDFSSVSDLKHRFNDDAYLLKELFDEDINADSVEKSLLYSGYQEILLTGEDNEMFGMMYKVREDLAVSLSAHIKLYHICTDMQIHGEPIVPWDCVDSEIYLADTWWEKDETILSDMREMPWVEFMVKYRAY